MTREITQYEIDKKYQVTQHIAEQKLQLSSTVKVGNENLMTISLLADKFSKAGNLIPKEFQGSPEKCFVAIYKGASLGLDAFTSLQRIAVINGRATIWGDTALSLVRKSGLLTKFKEEIIDQNGKLTAKCTVKRGDEDECTSEFSQDDAIKAGLWEQNTWAKYPKRMLKYRARAFALRDMFTDVIDGLYLKEEMEGEQILDVTPKTGNFFEDKLNEAKAKYNENPIENDVTQKIPSQEELEAQNQQPKQNEALTDKEKKEIEEGAENE